MNKEELKSLYDEMTPGQEQRMRMRQSLAAAADTDTDRPARSMRRRWIALCSAGVAAMIITLLLLPLGSGSQVYAIHVKIDEDTLVRLEDNPGEEQDTAVVSKVDARPGLEFYIEGEDIASIEITSETEHLYAVDWTRTQHEKYWNLEYYQQFDEDRQISIMDEDRLFDQSVVMTFDEGFEDYDQIWYRWTAWNMQEWAAADNFAHFLDGHMQLEGYPDQLKEDRLIITITDREGNVTTQVIHIQVSNNEHRQTVVSAYLET